MDRSGAVLRGAGAWDRSEYFDALGAGVWPGAVLVLRAAQRRFLGGTGEDDLGGRGDGLEDPVHFPADRRDDRPLAGGRYGSLSCLPGGGADPSLGLPADVLSAQLRPLPADRDLLWHRGHNGRDLCGDGNGHGRLARAHRRGDPLRRLLWRPMLAGLHQRAAGGSDHKDKHL